MPHLAPPCLPNRATPPAEKAAKADVRSLSSFIEKLVTDFLKKNGYLPK
jgi:hypothetical protein